jgi:hypothetical protein
MILVGPMADHQVDVLILLDLGLDQLGLDLVRGPLGPLLAGCLGVERVRGVEPAEEVHALGDGIVVDLVGPLVGERLDLPPPRPALLACGRRRDRCANGRHDGEGDQHAQEPLDHGYPPADAPRRTTRCSNTPGMCQKTSPGRRRSVRAIGVARPGRGSSGRGRCPPPVRPRERRTDPATRGWYSLTTALASGLSTSPPGRRRFSSPSLPHEGRLASTPPRWAGPGHQFIQMALAHVLDPTQPARLQTHGRLGRSPADVTHHDGGLCHMALLVSASAAAYLGPGRRDGTGGDLMFSGPGEASSAEACPSEPSGMESAAGGGPAL